MRPPHRTTALLHVLRTGVIAVTIFTTGCETGPLKDVHLPALPSSPFSDDDPSVRKITPDASIPILLLSNKQNTAFTVNGEVLNEAKSLKVKVPHEPLTITAKAPCYRALEQRADANGFAPMSQFEFTFALWDKEPSTGRHDCT
ncbi:MAG TPA: hypothetical protein VGC09_11425 [Rhodopila sp.]